MTVPLNGELQNIRLGVQGVWPVENFLHTESESSDLEIFFDFSFLILRFVSENTTTLLGDSL